MTIEHVLDSRPSADLAQAGCKKTKKTFNQKSSMCLNYFSATHYYCPKTSPDTLLHERDEQCTRHSELSNPTRGWRWGGRGKGERGGGAALCVEHLEGGWSGVGRQSGEGLLGYPPCCLCASRRASAHQTPCLSWEGRWGGSPKTFPQQARGPRGGSPSGNGEGPWEAAQ